MTCEVFEYGDSILDTGIPAVDNTEMESGVPLVFFGGSGTFKQDERIVVLDL